MGDARNARAIAIAASAGRTALGAAALLAPRRTGRAFGFPEADINPSAHLLVRLLGVRDTTAGVANLLWLSRHSPTRTVAVLNLALDGGDALSCMAGLAARRGPARALLRSLAVAAPVAAMWARMAVKLEETGTRA